MKHLLFVLLLLLTINSYSQGVKNDYDSLRKYSYPLIGFTTENGYMGRAGGTCFFVRKKERIFLITAKHVVSGCGMGDRNTYPNVMNIWVQDTGGNFIEAIPINTSIIIDTANCPDSLGHPDIIAFEIKNDSSYKLNSVENFLLPYFEKTDNIEMFGYNVKSYTVTQRVFLVNKANHIHFDRKEVKGYGGILTKDSGIIDMSYFLLILKNFKNDSTMHGYSGSPIFIKELHSNRLKVMGVFSIFGYDKIKKDYNYWEVPKIEYAIDEIDDILRH